MSSHDAAPSSCLNTQAADTLLVQGYRRLLALSARALQCARQHEWDTAAEHFTAYTEGFDRLVELPAPTPADAQICQELITQLLAHETQLRELIEPERNRLNLEMGNLKRQTTVLTAYSAPVLTHER